MMPPNHQQRTVTGFTLIELIIVVVIIGVLVAVGAAKYIDNSQAARIKRLQSLADGIGAASALNYQAYLFHEPYQPTLGMPCATLLNASHLLTVDLPSSIAVSGTIYSNKPSGTFDACRLVDSAINDTSQNTVYADMIVVS